MFKSEDTAIAVRENMRNIIWLLTASIERSPVRESALEEKLAYSNAVRNICDSVKGEVLTKIFSDFPTLSLDFDEDQYPKAPKRQT